MLKVEENKNFAIVFLQLFHLQGVNCIWKNQVLIENAFFYGHQVQLFK